MAYGATVKAAILTGDTSEAVVDLLLLSLGIDNASVNLPARCTRGRGP